MRRPISAAALQRQCDAFNAQVSVGQTVDVRKDDRSVVRTTTRSKAQVLSGHTAVVWLDGISGCYLLERVAVPPPSYCGCGGDPFICIENDGADRSPDAVIVAGCSV